MEESARAELWREELIEEIEQKVGGLRELEEAGKKEKIVKWFFYISKFVSIVLNWLICIYYINQEISLDFIAKMVWDKLSLFWGK